MFRSVRVILSRLLNIQAIAHSSLLGFVDDPAPSSRRSNLQFDLPLAEKARDSCGSRLPLPVRIDLINKVARPYPIPKNRRSGDAPAGVNPQQSTTVMSWVVEFPPQVRLGCSLCVHFFNIPTRCPSVNRRSVRFCPSNTPLPTEGGPDTRAQSLRKLWTENCATTRTGGSVGDCRTATTEVKTVSLLPHVPLVSF